MEPTLINLVLKLNCSELATDEDQMSLTARELNQLKKIAAVANQMIAKAEANLAAAEAKASQPAKTAKKAPVKADTKAAKKAAPKAAKKAVKSATKEVAPKSAKKVAPKPAKAPKAAAPKASAQDGKRTRRTGDELVAFRQMLSDERKNGVSVAELSKQHGVSAAYIYQL
jgi:outer membrane biosynthesis protein TonB